MKDIIVIGAGGFSKSILDTIDYCQFKVVGFLDSYKTGEFQGYKILGSSLNEIEKERYEYFIGIGDPNSKEKWFLELKKESLRLINIIDKSSLVSRSVELGEGIFIGKMAIVNANTIIEDNVIINTRALVEHGNHIKKHSNISTNTVLNGDIIVEKNTFIGSCTVVNGQVKIGENVTIGSGSVVIEDIEDNIVVVGSPTRLIRRKGNE